MARERSFGAMLRDARERKGLDLESVSRRLRIRTDILLAMEQGDMAKLPPAGYSKNMVSAYARLVGVDPRAASSRYLDALHLFETGRTRTRPDRGRDRGDMPPRSSSLERAPHRTRSQRPTGRTSARSERMPARSRAHDATIDIPDTRGRRYGTPGASYEREERPSRDHFSIYEERGYAGSWRPARESIRSYAFEDEGRPARSRTSSRTSSPADRRQARDGGRTSSGARGSARSERERTYSDRIYGSAPADPSSSVIASALGGLLSGRVAFVIVVLLLAALVGFLFSNLSSCGSASTDDELPTVPISGLTPTSSYTQEDLNASPVSLAPSSATFAFQVSDGSTAWVEVYVDGSDTPTTAETITGPFSSEGYEFSGSVLFQTANPDGVTATLNGKRVELAPSATSDIYYEYYMPFSTVLEEWNAQLQAKLGNPSSSASSSASGGTPLRSSSASSASSADEPDASSSSDDTAE